MNSMTRENGVFRGIGWLVGSAIVLLFTSAGLTLLGNRALGHTDVSTVLLLFHFAAWSYVVGVLGLVFPSVSWLLLGMTRRAVRRTPAEWSDRRPEHSELDAHQFLEHGVAKGIANRSARAGREEKEATSLTRVA